MGERDYDIQIVMRSKEYTYPSPYPVICREFERNCHSLTAGAKATSIEKSWVSLRAKIWKES